MSLKLELINEKSCRVCFLKCPERATDVSEIAEEFYEATGYKIHPNDRPQKICNNCMENLITVRTFKEICEKSENFLKEMRLFWKTTVKEKPPEIKEEESLEIKDEISDLEDHKEEPTEEKPPSVETKPPPERTYPGRVYKKRRWPTKKNWQYQDLDEHLRKNSIEISKDHQFVLDFNSYMPKNTQLPENLDNEEYENEFSCTYCSYKSIDIILIRKHSETECKNKKFRCPCSNEFPNLDVLRKHISKRHPKKRVLYRELQCNFCKFSSCYGTVMEKHCRKMHENDWESCAKCGEIFYCDDLKLQHIVFRCNKGDVTLQIPFSAIFGVESSIDTKGSATEMCEICGTHVSRVYMKAHIEKDHQKIRYECDLCGKSYNAKYNLVKHMQANHLGRNEYPCKHCDRVFRTWSTRRYHTQAKHSENPRPYVCKICGKGCSKPSALTNHLATHSDVRTILCTECPATFHNKSQLAAHKLRVHSTGKFVCPICGKIFKGRELLRQHKTSHQANKYFCPNCPVTFSANSSLRVHMTKKHPEYALPPPGTILRNKNLNKLQ